MPFPSDFLQGLLPLLGKTPKLLSTSSWLFDGGPVTQPLWYSPVKWEDNACLLYLMGLRHKSCFWNTPIHITLDFTESPNSWFLNHSTVGAFPQIGYSNSPNSG